MEHPIHRSIAHVFLAELSLPLEQLQLLSGSIWCFKLGSHRPLAYGLLEVMQHVLTSQG